MKESTKPLRPEAAVDVLLDDANLELKLYPSNGDYIRLKDKIDQIYDCLEQMVDYQYRGISNEKEISNATPRNFLEGWDFGDLTRERDPMHPRVAKLGTYSDHWVEFTREIKAVTLFGRSFGKILRPTNIGSCMHWATMPKERDYLAVSVSDLRQIMEIHGGCEETNPMQLTDRIVWYNPDVVFGPCRCFFNEEHSDFTQVLISHELGKRLPSKDTVSLDEYGAYVFGRNDNFEQLWKETGHPDRSGDNVRTFQRTTRNQSPPETIHDGVEMPEDDPHHYLMGRTGKHDIVAAGLPIGSTGRNAAATLATHMQRTFKNIKFCLLVGIGGGVASERDDIRLGDVVVSLPTKAHAGVMQYYFGKAHENGVFENSGLLQAPPTVVRTAITCLVSGPELYVKPLLDYIQDIKAAVAESKHPGQKKDKLFASDYLHDADRGNTCDKCNDPLFPREERADNHPRIHYGLIASENQVIRSAEVRDRLSFKLNILCFEMEGAEAVTSISCLVIRGICDYADSHKNDLWQEYAAATAAVYAKLLLNTAKNLWILGFTMSGS